MRSIRPFLAALVLPVLCITLAAGASAAHAAPVAVNCFNPALWSADQSLDPCTTVTAPDNDVVRVIQGTRSQEQAECVISVSNIGDARCHRIAGNRAAPGPVVSPAPSSRYAVASNPIGFSKLAEVQEDGSERVGIFLRHSFVSFYCILSNPTEESGHYTIPCFP